MKHLLWVVGALLALGAAPATAQTRVSVAVGFGVPQPFVHGFVVVGSPYAFYPPARVIIVRRPYFRRPPLVFVRRLHRAHGYRRHRWYDDDDR